MDTETSEIDSDQKMYANRMLDRPISPPPSIRPALVTTAICAGASLLCVVFLVVLAGPPLLALFREFATGGLSDPNHIESAVRGFLSPGLWIVALLSFFAVGATALGAIWLLIVLLMRGINR